MPYGLYDKRKGILDELGIPTLILESSTADPRDYSETQIRSQVDAFLVPILDRKKKRKVLKSEVVHPHSIQ